MLVPTYNNARTLERVLREAAAQGLPVVVADDASTDTTPEILERMLAEGVVHTVLRAPKNLGKAGAMTLGFARCAAIGFTHAITIDSDLQHDPARIPDFEAIVRLDPDAYVLGCRFPLHVDQPRRNLLGRTLSNVAIRAHCGLTIGDAPCGMRAWPLHLLDEVHGRSGRYAWEEEMISRAVWAGWRTASVDIPSIYLPPQERVSHYSFSRDWSEGIGIYLLLLLEALFPWRRCRRGSATSGLKRRALALFVPGPFSLARPEGRTEAWFVTTATLVAIIVLAVAPVSWFSLVLIAWVGWRWHAGFFPIVVATAASISALLSPWLVAIGLGIGLAGIVGGSRLSPTLRRPLKRVRAV